MVRYFRVWAGYLGIPLHKSTKMLLHQKCIYIYIKYTMAGNIKFKM